ncbi:MAG: hypothetical protein WDZ72_08305 [Cyclobacteriaceae bacterium]
MHSWHHFTLLLIDELRVRGKGCGNPVLVGIPQPSLLNALSKSTDDGFS